MFRGHPKQLSGRADYTQRSEAGAARPVGSDQCAKRNASLAGSQGGDSRHSGPAGFGVDDARRYQPVAGGLEWPPGRRLLAGTGITLSADSLRASRALILFGVLYSSHMGRVAIRMRPAIVGA